LLWYAGFEELKEIRTRLWLIVIGLALLVGAVVWYTSADTSCSRLREAMYNPSACYKTLQVTYVDRTDSPTAYGTLEIIRQPGVGAWARHLRTDGSVYVLRTDGEVYTQTEGVGPVNLVFQQRPSGRVLLGLSLDRLKRLFSGPPAGRPAYLEDREQLPLGIPYELTFPSSFVTNIYDQSKVDDLGEEVMLGRRTEKLVVTNKYHEVYTWNVDKETGVILRHELRIRGGPPFLLEATRFVVNEPVDSRLFAVPH
jgi:hypothetical protein